MVQDQFLKNSVEKLAELIDKRKELNEQIKELREVILAYVNEKFPNAEKLEVQTDYGVIKLNVKKSVSVR